MSEIVEKSLADQMQDATIRIELEACARTFKAKTEIILDDNIPLFTKLKAMDGIREVIRYAGANAAHNGPLVAVYPHTMNLFKGLISLVGKRMPEDDAYAILLRTHAILWDFVCGPCRSYHDLTAPLIFEICTTAIRPLLHYRRELRFIEIFYKIFEFKFKMFNNCSIEIFVSNGLLSILANIITTHTMLKTVEESDRETFLIYALKFLRDIFELGNPEKLPRLVVEETAFPVINCILNCTSRSRKEIIMEGHAVIYRLLRTGGKEMIRLKFVNGKTGLHYVLLVAEHTLEMCENPGDKFPDYFTAQARMLSMLQRVVLQNLESGGYSDKIRNRILKLTQTDPTIILFPGRRSLLHKMYLKGVRALLRTLDGGDVEGTDVVGETFAAHADVRTRT